MAKLQTIGRLGNVKERSDGKWLSFGVAEPSYKAKDSDEYITPWFNFLIPGDSKTAEFLKKNSDKIDVVEVNANQRQADKDGNKTYYINVTAVDVITWKKPKDAEEAFTERDQEPVEEDADDAYPWDKDNQ